MKKLIFTILWAFGTAIKAQTVNLTVNIKNFKNDRGTVVVTLQDPSKKGIQEQTGKIINNVSQVIFKNLMAGKYAISLFHDENNNKKMDAGIFKIPTEGWGVSNDAKGNFGPPKFEDMLFMIEESKAISITIQ